MIGTAAKCCMAVAINHNGGVGIFELYIKIAKAV
jgi:hypothetical protein